MKTLTLPNSFELRLAYVVGFWKLLGASGS